MNGAGYFTNYDSGLGREQILCFGDANPAGARLLILPPLFDEMSRMRRTLVMAMRFLAARGIASALPDLPGQNESLVPLYRCRLGTWEKAVRAAALSVQATHSAGVRSACITDTVVSHLPRWRYLPISGDRIVTQLIRAQLASDKAAGRHSNSNGYYEQDENVTVSLSGYRLSGGLLTDLKTTVVQPLTEAKDMHVDSSLGPALWLRAEPGESVDLASAMAAQWADWMTQ